MHKRVCPKGTFRSSKRRNLLAAKVNDVAKDFPVRAKDAGNIALLVGDREILLVYLTDP